MFICNNCEETFEEAKTIREGRGECRGVPCSEVLSVSPCCEDDYGDAKECICCGEFFSDEKLTNSICADCGEACITCGEHTDIDELEEGVCEDCRRMDGDDVE